jgi:hypothetical protein
MCAPVVVGYIVLYELVSLLVMYMMVMNARGRDGAFFVADSCCNS